MSDEPFHHRLAEQCVNLRLRRATRTATRIYDAALRPLDLRVTQLALLAVAASGPSLSITAMAEALGLERSGLTRNLRPLERRGLLRVGPEGPRRERRIELTAAGHELLHAAEPHWQEAQRTLRKLLGEPQARELHGLLDRLHG